MNDINSKFDELYEFLGTKFDAIDQRFDVVDQKFDVVDQKFDVVDQKFEAMNQKFDQNDEKFISLESRIDGLRSDMNDKFLKYYVHFEKRFDYVDMKFAEAKLERMNLAGSISSLSGKVESNSVEILALGSRLDRAGDIFN